jgi:type IV pilus assembly protein PilO
MKLQLNMKKLPKIPKRVILPLMLLVTILIVVAGYFLLLTPQFEEKGRLEAELSHQRQELARLTAIKNGMLKQRSEYAQLQDRLKELVKQMPEQKDIPNLLRNVSAIGQETKLRIRFFEPKPMEAQEFYSELPFEIRYNGPYHTIGYFFDGVRRLDRIINVTSFAFEARPNLPKGTLEGVCFARTYVYTKEALPKEKGKQKKEGKDEAAGKK